MNCESAKQTQSNPTCGEHSRTIYGEPAYTERTCGEPVEPSRSVEPTKPISISKTLPIDGEQAIGGLGGGDGELTVLDIDHIIA